jgi:uncharacterized BrkB/YihY/UPF0761 family membrane protein
MKERKYDVLAVLGLIGFLVAFLPTPWVIAIGTRGLLDNNKSDVFVLVSTLSFITGLPILLMFTVLFPRRAWKRIALTSVFLLAYVIQVAVIGFRVLMLGIGQLHAAGR